MRIAFATFDTGNGFGVAWEWRGKRNAWRVRLPIKFYLDWKWKRKQRRIAHEIAIGLRGQPRAK